MSTPFLVGFSRVLLKDLRERELIDLPPEATDAAVDFVAAYLASAREGGSAVSAVSRALLACPAVDEVYVDDQTLKVVIQELDGTPATWVRG